MGTDQCIALSQDDYYHDVRKIINPGDPLPNFDAPEAIDYDLLIRDMLALKSGQSIHMPIYDFHTHTRKDETRLVKPHPMIILEGILVMGRADAADIFDFTYFVDCDEDLRFARRRERDICERGRTPESVEHQLINHVRPSHEEYTEPCRHIVTEVISQDTYLNQIEKQADSMINSWQSYLKDHNP